ncbi:MAG: hypothetical protein ACKN85_02770 [Pirellula sp.]
MSSTPLRNREFEERYRDRLQHAVNLDGTSMIVAVPSMCVYRENPDYTIVGITMLL